MTTIVQWIAAFVLAGLLVALGALAMTAGGLAFLARQVRVGPATIRARAT